MAHPSIGARAAVPTLVLDTNVVLDWLLFRDARCAALAEAIRVGQVRWVASPAMRAELQHVLTRGLRGGWTVDAASILQEWDRWATMVVAGDGRAPASVRCTDADDQKFIDLALQVRAQALLSNDRAVLELRRRAATHGLRILSADAWQRQALDAMAQPLSPD
jgi:predicted nucleic acid-binding protein